MQRIARGGLQAIPSAITDSVVVPHPNQLWRLANFPSPPHPGHAIAQLWLASDPVVTITKGCHVKSQVLFAGVIAAVLAAPLAAQAQGIPGGIAHGASEGWRIAGPVGAVVGAPVGGVIGGVEGLLGIGPAYREPEPQVAPRRTVRKSKKSRRAARTQYVR